MKSEIQAPRAWATPGAESPSRTHQVKPASRWAHWPQGAMWQLYRPGKLPLGWPSSPIQQKTRNFQELRTESRVVGPRQRVLPWPQGPAAGLILLESFEGLHGVTAQG